MAARGILVEIPVRYDGEDLAEVAQMLGITREELVRRHTGSAYSVAFVGFAPVSPTSRAATKAWTCRAAPRRARASPRAPWAWRVGSAACTRRPAPGLADHRHDAAGDVGPGAPVPALLQPASRCASSILLRFRKLLAQNWRAL
ncbi:urea amidolyase related protein [Alicycliphilus sp. B1]|nr:urea amidolyase related protein [Alicycliphilus sp. B1]